MKIPTKNELTPKYKMERLLQTIADDLKQHWKPGNTRMYRIAEEDVGAVRQVVVPALEEADWIVSFNTGQTDGAIGGGYLLSVR